MQIQFILGVVTLRKLSMRLVPRLSTICVTIAIAVTDSMELQARAIATKQE
jgi:hypothetical protein